MTWLDPFKVALTITAGIGGVVALVVAFRKQGLAERQDVADAFVTAITHLGDGNPVTRLAGTYGMANLADVWPGRRQQCVDVLCAYLRLPWNITAGEDPASSLDTDRDLYSRFPDELEVRETMLRVIGEHLRPRRGPGWSQLSLDLSGALLPDVHWAWATVGANTVFNQAVFLGRADFGYVNFGKNVSFGGAVFGDQARFAGAQFGDGACFDEATFGDQPTFSRAVFLYQARFEGAQFGDGACFDEATFGDQPTFSRARFGDRATFQRTTFGRWGKYGGLSFGKGAHLHQTAFADGRRPTEFVRYLPG